MTAPSGGSLTELMSNGDDIVTKWLEHVEKTRATTPEIIAQVFMEMEHVPNKVSLLAVLFATALQRLASVDGPSDARDLTKED